jgi:hypothetical protein
MKTQEIKEALGAEMVSKKGDTYIARWGFFYTFGQAASSKADKVRATFSHATVVDCQEIWKPFKGGAPIQRQSHFRVDFKLPA